VSATGPTSSAAVPVSSSTRTGGRALVLSVDDAHLLDDLSATLVHQMAATGAALVVATLRSDEPAPDPIVALWKDDAVERLDVSGLDASSVEQLLLAVLGGPVDRGAVHRLVIGSQGTSCSCANWYWAPSTTGACAMTSASGASPARCPRRPG